MGEGGRSLAETPTWSVATVTTLMVAACFLVERALSRFAKWLRKTKRKAMFAALEKIREELMLLGVISLLLSQTAHWISEICVPSSLFSSKFYICSEKDFDHLMHLEEENQTSLATPVFGGHVCREGHEPFVSYEGLEQLHRFLFILGITHVLYSFVTVVLSMIKIYSWRKWETLAGPIAAEELKGRSNRTSTEIVKPNFKGSITRSDYLALRLGFVTYHKLPHSYDFHKYMVRSMEDDYNGTIGIRLVVQFWCSYSTLPLNVIISQMGSKFKKSLVSENVRESLHSWCKRVKDRNRHNPLFSRNGTVTSRSVCSLDTTYETDHETNTVCTLSRTASASSLDDQLTVGTIDDDEPSCMEKDV
ncbi:hypothetical protein PR202_ga25141 [Eleusine coracana subsp. coracana]|uniref:MLO-like protein n=1 Tax=Eleusine coracana subsp. coracana TaxID=191504 RepID=A0AAV5DAP9_ELECO|nr:hypothetical protein PR202_ga25141 [Eleusine coracana subsp. coracana]